MRISPAQALAELERAIAGDRTIDISTCRRLALRVSSAIPDADASLLVNETLCAVIDAHADDPLDARERIELLRPAIETLASAPH